MRSECWLICFSHSKACKLRLFGRRLLKFKFKIKFWSFKLAPELTTSQHFQQQSVLSVTAFSTFCTFNNNVHLAKEHNCLLFDLFRGTWKLIS